jgi:hypothetical protein
MTARAHTEARMQGERPQELFGNWRRLLSETFRGMTTDGTAIPGLFSLKPDGAPTAAVVDAVNVLMAALDRRSRQINTQLSPRACPGAHPTGLCPPCHR